MVAPARLIREFTDVYTLAEQHLIEALAGAVKKADKRDLTVQQQEAQRLQRRVNEIARNLAQDSAAVGRSVLYDADLNGGRRAIADLDNLLGPAGRDYDSPINQGALDGIARSLSDTLTPAHLSITRTVPDAYKEIVGRAVVGVVVGQETRVQASQRILDEFAARGITGFTDKAGRRWDLAVYAEMAARSAIIRASLDAQTARYQAEGVDLVYVSDSPEECPLCARWEHKVISLTGVQGPHTVQVENWLTDELETVAVAGTLAYARAQGLHHPNCGHGISAWRPGITKLKTSDQTEAPEAYKARQQLRGLERKVRAAKRVEMAAMTPDAKKEARKQVRRWESRIRDHVKETGATRVREREQVKVGNAGDSDGRLRPSTSPLPDDTPMPKALDVGVRRARKADLADRLQLAEASGDQAAADALRREQERRVAELAARRASRSRTRSERAERDRAAREVADRAAAAKARADADAEQARRATERQARIEEARRRKQDRENARRDRAAAAERERAENQRATAEKEAERQRAEEAARVARLEQERRRAVERQARLDAARRRREERERQRAAERTERDRRRVEEEAARRRAEEATRARAEQERRTREAEQVAEAARIAETGNRADVAARDVEAAIDARVDDLHRQVNPAGNLPDRVVRERLAENLNTPAWQEAVVDDVRRSLEGHYPDLTAAEAAAIELAVKRDVGSRFLDSGGKTSPGRGTRVYLAAVDRSRNAASIDQAVQAARDATPNAKFMAGRRGTLAVDPRDGGPNEEWLDKMETVKQAGAAISVEVNRRFRDRPELHRLPAAQQMVELAAIRREVLSEIRPMGGQDGAMPRAAFGDGLDTPAARREAEELLRFAASNYPTEWVREFEAHTYGQADTPGLVLTQTQLRAMYWARHDQSQLEIGTYGDLDYKRAVTTHELGHGMEDALPQIKMYEWVFLMSRISTGAPGTRTFDSKSVISSSDDGDETGYRDDFIEHYSGRTYGGRPDDGAEILTTGVQQLMGGENRWFADPDYEHLILGMLAVL